MPSRITVNFSAGATPSSTRSSRTSGLTATSRVGVPREARARSRGRLRAHRVEVAAQHVPVVGVDDDRAAARRRRAARRCGRRRLPWRCACAGCAAAPAGSRRTSARAPRAGRRPARSRGGAAATSTTSTPSVVGDERHRVLAAGELAGDERRVVAARARGPGEVRDVERGPAHVQPGDHAAGRGRLGWAQPRRASTVRRRPSSSETVGS